MPDLLLEVLSEEIPARMQAGGAAELSRHILSRLKEAGLSNAEDELFATPRRLAVLVRGLPAAQPNITVERKGPRVDAPDKAIQGFLKSTGLTLEDLEQRETPKGPVWFAAKQEPGRPTADLLTDLLPQALAAVFWPKSMRWESSGERWVRPIRSILCLLDDAVVPFRFGGIRSGRTTLGHRFLSSGPLTVEHADDYVERIGDYKEMPQQAKVMLDFPERFQRIADEAKAQAQSETLEFPHDHELLIENAGLVEWPVVLIGSIDARYMDLPAEVLRSSMGIHQRYFGLLHRDGRPAPRFVMVANIETENDSAAVIAGNERVLRARLADARFFWEQDRRQKLEDRADALAGVVFHARLGSMHDKAKRIEKLARSLFVAIKDANRDWAADNNPDEAARAGLLSKADLVTQMVGEFPDLQGVMGSYYAEHQKEPEVPPVCRAIRQHYAPQGPSDRCPKLPVSVTVALADKFDTLAGFFAIDERPTGSRDPFALRRAALGVVRLIIENALRLSLGDALTLALAGYGDLLPKEAMSEATKRTLLAFIVERFRVVQHRLGYGHDLVSAVFAVSGEDDLVRLQKRVDALHDFLNEVDGANLLTAYRRAANILRIEEKRDSTRYEGNTDPSLFAQEEERKLHHCIANANATAMVMLGGEHFGDVMDAMATLREPVDAFFDNVTVNCEDPALRRNRLLMLSQIRSTLDRVADFSKIEGG